jgi:hypothetical protein
MSIRRLLWHGIESPWWLAGIGGAVLVAIGLIIWLHAYERRLVSPRLGWTLLLLRLAVVACIFVVLLEPVLSWTTDRERTGRVVVAVDASFSMDTKDFQATPAEKLRWARAAGMIGNEEMNSRVDRWIAAYEKNQEPEWATAQEEPDEARRRNLAVARRDNVQSLLREVEKLSRKDLVQRLLTGGSKSLLDRIDQQAKVELEVFAGSAADTDEENLVATLRDPPQSVQPQATDLMQAVTTALSKPGSGPLAGVVIFTDGRNSDDAATAKTLDSLKDVAAPVYPVIIGSDRRPKDLAIAVLDAPPTVFQHDKSVIRSTIRTSGFIGQEIKVELERVDKPDEKPLVKTIKPEHITTNVEFEIDGDELGRRKYRLKMDVLPDETRKDNNERQFTLQVVDDQADVLVLDGEPRWEFRYIESAFKRDERVKLDAVVFKQPYLGLLPDTFFPRSVQMPEDLSDLADSPFSKYDLVIIGDVAPQHLSDAGWKLLDRYVRDEGGTLVMTAGKRFFPRAHRSEIVQSLMPVTDLEEKRMDDLSQTGSPQNRGFHWRMTAEGDTLDALKFSAEEAENRRLWAQLPGHMWGLVGRAKPGASVWAAEESEEPNPGLDWEREHALFAQQFVGTGQTVWLGIDSTWRWRYLVADQYHHRFWGQLARWAAEFKSAVGNEFVRFGVDRPSISIGEDAVVRARWDAKLLKRFPDLKARAKVFRLDGNEEVEAASIDLKPAAERPLIHEGRAAGLKPGEYRIRLETENAKVGDEAIMAELLVTEPLTPELADVSANPAWLGQLAQATKGRLFHPHELDELPRMFEQASETFTTREEVSLWDHWFVLAILFALLTSEWVLRKVNGLP